MEEKLPFADDGELVCYCLGVSAFTIKKAIYTQNLKTVAEVTAATKAGGGCQSCHWKIQELIDEVNSLKLKQAK